MELYFIRHAQSENNALWAETGSDLGRKVDPELTELGIKQAYLLADFLAAGNRDFLPGNGSGFNLTHLYSSLMVRAVMTGTIAAKRLGIPLQGWQEIHERGGIYQEDDETGEQTCLPGMDREYFTNKFPDFVLPDNFIETGWWDSRPVEGPPDCYQRAEVFLSGLVEKHGGTEDRVGIISHGGFYNDLLWALFGYPYHPGVWFLMYNTAITRVDFEGERRRVAYNNRMDHLPSDLVS
jgi:2,3-bisphosphoglycerate-dependent phosphoglycerate mutase